jgi:hypothetical protein
MDLRTCNYCKKSGHIKADCQALKAKNEKFQQKGNLCGSSSIDLRRTIGVTMEADPNILALDSTIEVEVLLTTEEATS